MSFAETLPHRRFTADEVMRMLEVGLLTDDEPVELLNGELVLVSPQGPKHSSRAVHIRRLLERAYGPHWHVRDHSPVSGTVDSIPEPDLAVVRGEPLSFEARLPAADDVALVVEISFSSQRIDRKKASIYARAGYACYWLIDTEAQRVEVFRAPTVDGRYGQTELVAIDGELALPLLKTTIAVRSLIA